MILQRVVFRVAVNLVRFHNLILPWFFLRVSDLGDDIVPHQLVIEVLGAFHIKTKPPHFAFGFAARFQISIVLWAATDKFGDVFTV